MIITCPSCGASFNIKPEALGPNGRSVKCSKCAHRWHATADEEASGAQAAAAAAAASADPASPPAADADAAPAPTAEASQPDEEAPPASESDANAAHAEDAPPAPAMPAPDMREALGLPADVNDAEDKAAPSRSGRRAKTPARKPRRNTARVLSIFVLLLAVCGAAGTAVFMKNEIMIWLPATERFYAMVGIVPEVLGRGLQIVEPTPKKEIDGNDEILIVEGEIRNVTEKPVEIPLMRGALLDAHGKELQTWTFTAAKSRIAPGENARYRTEFRNPPVEAESLDITFTRGTAAPDSAKLEHKQDGGMMTESTAQHH